MELREQHSGQVVHVPVGARLTIRLPENPTTGYQWSLEDPDNQYVRLIRRYYEIGDAAAVGGGGRRCFALTALQPGRFTLRLVHQRAWQKVSIGEFTLQIVIG
jgi:inhibitor of cysteine peptidase